MLNPKIKAVEPKEPFMLRLEYDSGEVRLFDVEPYISGSWFGMLRDKNYFKTVHLLPDGSGVEWADGQDIAPHELYELSVALS